MIITTIRMLGYTHPYHMGGSARIPVRKSRRVHFFLSMQVFTEIIRISGQIRKICTTSVVTDATRRHVGKITSRGSAVNVLMTTSWVKYMENEGTAFPKMVKIW
jgi:hypothetical protein